MNVRQKSASGFTLVELLVVIAIIAILVMLLLPAVNSVREAARRTQCVNQVMQLIVAVQNYEQAHEVYPPGTINNTGPIQNQPIGYQHSWLVQLLPYTEEKSTYRHVDKSVGVYHANNRGVRELTIYVYQCPSAGENADVGISNYAGVHHDVEAPIDVDNHGVFFLNSRVRYEDVTDGTGQTLFIGEKWGDDASDLGWMSGTRATLRNTGTPINETGPNPPGVWQPLVPESERYDDGFQPDDGADVPGTEAGTAEVVDEGPAEGQGQLAPLLYVGGFGSQHPTGANFAFGNGRVLFLNDDIDQQAFEQMGHRADGKLLNLDVIGR